jgi:predicted RNase H-like nuclease
MAALEAGQRFVGIDLAWSPRNATGVAALAPTPAGLAVAACGLAGTDAEIVAFVRAHLGTATVVMVDAPLRVPNETGRRACEDAVARAFGRFEASPHASNRSLFARYGGPRGERLVAALGAAGVREGELAEAGQGHLAFECYPHPAHVRLFGLARTLKYKKKRQSWDEARAAFAALVAHLRALRDPALLLPPALLDELDVTGRVGRGYKAREDRVDAICCAYLGALAALGRMEMLGSVAAGHIVVPRAPLTDGGDPR